MAAFISSTWQGTQTRIPETRTKFSENQSAYVVHQVLSLASPQTRREAKDFLEGSASGLTPFARMELDALVKGYVQSGAER